MGYNTNEAARLEALRSYHIIDTPEEEEYNALARLATQICGAELSQINLVDAHRQWTKSHIPGVFKELPREIGFCNYTIQQDEWMIVEDASKDERFSHWPYVEKDPNVRFYAGVNLKSDDGYNIGTICVLDTRPRGLTEEQLNSLKILAHEVEARLALRKQQYSLEAKNKKLSELNTFLKSSTDLVFMVEPEGYVITEMNEQVEKFLEYKPDELVGRPLGDLAPEEGFIKQLDSWKQQPETEFVREAIFRKKSGDLLWMRIHLAEKQGRWYATARDINQRRLQEERIERSLREKEVLLAEIHHRVKNNMAVISSLLQIESLNTQSKAAQKSLQNSYMRILSMAFVHERLYESGDFAHVSFKPFMDSIIQNMNHMYSRQHKEIMIRTDVDDMHLNVNQAIPLALVVNELLSNAFTYAFDGKKSGSICVRLSQSGDDIELVFADDGAGLPDHIDVSTQSTTGFTLVNVLVDQMEATLEVETGKGAGTTFRLVFKQNEKPGSSCSMPTGPH